MSILFYDSLAEIAKKNRFSIDPALEEMHAELTLDIWVLGLVSYGVCKWSASTYAGQIGGIYT